MSSDQKSITTPDLQPGEAVDHTVLAEWSVHLLRDQPSKVLWVAVATAVAGLFGALSLQQWIGAVLGCVFILMSVAEFVFPIRYRLTSSGVSCRYGVAYLAMEWREVRRVIQIPDGLRLSPFAKPTRLDGFRGLLVRLPGGARSNEGEHIRSLILAHVESASCGR